MVRGATVSVMRNVDVPSYSVPLHKHHLFAGLEYQCVEASK